MPAHRVTPDCERHYLVDDFIGLMDALGSKRFHRSRFQNGPLNGLLIKHGRFSVHSSRY